MSELEDQIFALFLQFCRIGGCFLFAPGFSSPRVPVHVRLFAAMGLTAALAPLIQQELLSVLSVTPREQQVYMIFGETLIGAAIGLMARFFFLALQFAGPGLRRAIV